MQRDGHITAPSYSTLLLSPLQATTQLSNTAKVFTPFSGSGETGQAGRFDHFHGGSNTNQTPYTTSGSKPFNGLCCLLGPYRYLQ